MRCPSPAASRLAPRRWRGLLALAALVAAPVGASAQVSAPARALANDAANTTAAVRLVANEVRGTIAREKRFPLDRRYVDATLAYERGNYSVAAVLFVDLIYKPEFQRTRDYYEALHMLGVSLYRQRNYFAARRYLDVVVRKVGGRHFEDALQYLIDIAIRLRRFDDVSQYATFLGQVPPGARRAELFYQFGRSYFAAGRFAEARKYLGQVSVGEKPWPAARFYLGALLVQDGKLDDAQALFSEILSAGQSRDAAQRPAQIILDYTYMASARLHLQAKRYQEAARLYGSIDRASLLYEDALYELAATHVAAKEPRLALAALDTLLLGAREDRVAVEAAVLRGRINLMLKEYDAADGSYKDVVDRYSAINGELTRFARSTELLESFFTWLLHRGGDDYSVVRPVSERVARFIETDPDMGRVVQLFDEMAGEKRDVKECRKLAEGLDAALRSNARLEMFPALRDKWRALLEHENKLVQLGQRAVLLLRKASEGALGAGAEASRIATLERINAALYRAFSRIPATARAYTQRQSRVDNALNELAAQISLLRAELGQRRDEVMAIEKMLNERVFGADSVVLPKEREAKIRAQIEEEKHALRRLGREIDQLATDLEIDAAGMGSGDKVNLDEARVRGALLANQRQLQEAYAAALRRSGRAAADIATLGTVRAAIDQTLVEIAGIFREIDRRVGEKSAELVKVLQVEKGRIADYQLTVSRYEQDARGLARDIGYTLIRRTQGRLADIVLEADLGLVDVAWQRKQDAAAKIRGLQDERSGKVKNLQRTLEDLSDSGDEEEEP